MKHKPSKKHLVLAVMFIALLSGIGFYNFTFPVDTPPYLSGESKPLSARFVVWKAYRGGFHDQWGQCKVCGFPVLDSDVRYGWGSSVTFGAKGYSWNEYLCIKHKVR